MEWNYQRSISKFSFFLVSLFISYCSFAAFPYTDNRALLQKLLKQYGVEVKTPVDLYNSAVSCHEKRLDKISYFSRPTAISIVFNDEFGNCLISAISTNEIALKASKCVISDSQYKTIFSSPHRDAIAMANANPQDNLVFSNFLRTLEACMQPVEPTELLNMMQNSYQVQYSR